MKSSLRFNPFVPVASRGLFFAGLMILSWQHALSATATWNNLGTNFNTGANWTGGTGAGGVPGSADVAQFTNAKAVDPNVTSSVTIQGLSYSAITSSGYTLSASAGQTLTLTNTGNGALTRAVTAANTSGINSISAPIILGGGAATTARFNQAAGGTLVLSGNISSTNAISGASFASSGNAVFTLSGTNTYSGTTSVGGQTLNINSNGALSTGDLLSSNSSHLNNTSGAPVTVPNGLVLTTTLPPNSLFFDGVSSVNNLRFNGAVDLSQTANTITVTNAGGTLTFGGAVNWGALQTSKNGAGAWVLNAANSGTGGAVSLNSVSYTSTARLSDGVTEIGNAIAFGPTGAVELNGGTLRAASPLTVTNPFVLSANSTLGGTNNLTLTGAFTANNNGSRTLTVSNTGTTTLSGTLSVSDTATSTQTLTVATTGGNTAISGSIQNSTVAGSGIGSFTKSGSGNLNLSGASIYTGQTQILDGTLQLSGTGSINNSSGIVINGAAAKYLHTSSVASTRPITITAGKLDGTGSVGAITVASGSGNTVATGNGTSSALTVSSLAFNGSGATSLTLAGGGTTTAPLVVSGNLTTSGGTASVVINATALSPLVSGTTYKLIGYGSFTGNLTDFTKGSFAGLSVRQLTFNNDTVNKFITVAFSGVADSLKWTGGDDNSWQAGLSGATKNWKLVTAGTNTDFIQGDDVRFDDTLTGSPAVNITGSVLPASTTFNNSTAVDYVLSSSGGFGIAGTGTVLKNGTGAVSFNTLNTYTGGTTLNAGTLNINTASAIGTGPLTITGGTIDNTRDDFTQVTLSTNNSQNWNGNFTFGGTIDLNLGNGPVTMNASRTVTTNGTATLRVGGSIGGGAVGLTKQGPGYLTLGGISTYTGGTIVNDGFLILTAGGTSGAIRGPLTINSGATVYLAANDALGTSALGDSVGTLTINNGTLTNNAGNQGSVTNVVLNGAVVDGAGSFRFATGFGISTPAAASASQFFAPINITGSSLVVTTGAGSTLNLGGTISGSALTKAGTGTMTLTAANTYTGATTVSAGTLQIGDGVLGAIASSSPVSISSGAMLGLDLADTAVISNSISNAGTINANGTGVNTISGPIGGGGNFIQSGTGTTILSGLNTYTGSTSVTDGTLKLSGSTTSSGVVINGLAAKVVSSIPLSAPVTLTKGTFDGTSTVSAVNVAAGAGNTVTNGNGGTSTLTAASVTFSGAGSLALNPIGGANTTTAPLVVTGAFTVPATSNSITINIAPGSPLINGTYNLVGYGSFSGSAAAFTKGTGFSSRQTVSFANNAGTKFITTTVSGDTPKWTGLNGDGGTWTTSTNGSVPAGSGNWKLVTAGTKTNFYAGDVILFDDTAAGTRTIDITQADVTPGMTTFNTAATNYNLTSSGGFGIAGTGEFIKNGTGKITVTSINTFTGPTTINTGTLQIGDGVTDGSIDGTSNIVNNGVLSYNLAFAKTLTKVVSGSGGFTTTAPDGVGLTLSAANSFSGGLTVNGGDLKVGNATALGAATNNLSFGATAGTKRLQLLGNSVSLGGINSDSSAIIENGVTGTAVLTINSASDSQFGGLIQNGTGTIALAKTGAAKLTLLGDNIYTGATTVTGGTLQVGNGISATGKLGNTALAVSAGTLSLQTPGAISQNTISLTGTGTLTESADNALSGTAALNLGNSLTLTRPNNHSGQTSITAGDVTLKITNRLSLGTGLIYVQQRANPVFQFHITGGGTIAVPNSYTQNRMSGTPTTFDVNNNGSGANGIVQINGTTTLGDTGTETLNVTGGNGYSLYLAHVAYGDFHPAAVAFNPTTAVLKIGDYTGGSGNTVTVNLDGTNTGNEIGNILQPGAVVSLTKSNTSTWSLTGTNTYTGSTTISGGTLQIGNGDTTGTLPATSAVTNNALLTFNRTDALAVSNTISGTGSVTQSGTGTTTLSGTNTYSGETAVNSGVLTIPTAFLSNTAAVRIGTAGTLNLTFGGTDTVGSFYIGGVQMAAGTWGSLTSAAANKTARITGNGILSVGGATSPYDSWATSKGLSGANNGPTQDPDFDGISNALEFVLGGNPLASDTGKLPVLTTDASNFIFSFTRDDASETEISLSFQWGSSLTAWTDVPVGAGSSTTNPVTVNITENTASPDTVQVLVPKTSAVGGKLFGHLKAVK